MGLLAGCKTGGAKGSTVWCLSGSEKSLALCGEERGQAPRRGHGDVSAFESSHCVWPESFDFLQDFERFMADQYGDDELLPQTF